MSAERDAKIKRLLELPCVAEKDGVITLTLKSEMYLTLESLVMTEDPVRIFQLVTIEQKEKILDAFWRKFRVLEEIQNGTNRYKIVGGDFTEIGEDG